MLHHNVGLLYTVSTINNKVTALSFFFDSEDLLQNLIVIIMASYQPELFIKWKWLIEGKFYLLQAYVFFFNILVEVTAITNIGHFTSWQPKPQQSHEVKKNKNKNRCGVKINSSGRALHCLVEKCWKVCSPLVVLLGLLRDNMSLVHKV